MYVAFPRCPKKVQIAELRAVLSPALCTRCVRAELKENAATWRLQGALWGRCGNVVGSSRAPWARCGRAACYLGRIFGVKTSYIVSTDLT